jgi:hypothetical protein
MVPCFLPGVSSKFATPQSTEIRQNHTANGGFSQTVTSPLPGPIRCGLVRVKRQAIPNRNGGWLAPPVDVALALNLEVHQIQAHAQVRKLLLVLVLAKVELFRFFVQDLHRQSQ